MDRLDQDFVDAEAEGHFTFAADGSGEFQFGSVSGGMGDRLTTQDGHPCVEWTWEGMTKWTRLIAAGGRF